MSIKRRLVQSLILLILVFSSTSSFATFFNADYESTEIFLDKPIALAANGPVVEFHLVIEKEEDYGTVLKQVQICRTSTNKVIQVIDIDSWLVYSSTFNLVDINFDGYKDMLILYSGGRAALYEGFLFNFSIEKFSEDSISLANPTINAETEEIIELSCGGCACGNYTKTFHKVYDGSLITVKKESQDVCGGDEKYYSLTELVDGEMIETVRKDLSGDY